MSRPFSFGFILYILHFILISTEANLVISLFFICKRIHFYKLFVGTNGIHFLRVVKERKEADISGVLNINFCIFWVIFTPISLVSTLDTPFSRVHRNTGSGDYVASGSEKANLAGGAVPPTNV